MSYPAYAWNHNHIECLEPQSDTDTLSSLQDPRSSTTVGSFDSAIWSHATSFPQLSNDIYTTEMSATHSSGFCAAYFACDCGSAELLPDASELSPHEFLLLDFTKILKTHRNQEDELVILEYLGCGAQYNPADLEASLAISDAYKQICQSLKNL